LGGGGCFQMIVLFAWSTYCFVDIIIIIIIIAILYLLIKL